MNKNITIVLVITALVIVAGVVLVNQRQQTQDQQAPTVVEEEDAVVEEQESDAMEKEEGEAMQESDDEDGDVVTVDITGRNFEFSQDEIRVKKGQKVRIEFASEQGFHDWVVDEFDAQTKQIPAGDSSAVEFVADKAGEFEYYCSVGNHRQLGMVGTLIVE